DIGLLLNAEIRNDRKAAAQKKPFLSKPQILSEHPMARLRPNTRIDAYTIQHQGRTFGVLRIPNYAPKASDVMNEILWINEVLGRFEGMTDALIIDQTGNTGGYVGEVMNLASFFASEGPLETGTIQIRL